MKIALTTQGDFFRAKLTGLKTRSKTGGGRRGAVRTFTPASRKRMLQMVATIVNTKAIFLTLTYGQEYPIFKDTKRDVDVFCKRLKREFPSSGILWRVERQKRGAPHIHLLIWGVPFLHWNKVREWWSAVIDEKYHDWSSGKAVCPHVHGEILAGTRQVMYYVTKYCAKNDPLHLDSLMSHISPQQMEITGRHWGIIGREFIPVAEKTIYWLAYSDDAWSLIKWCASGTYPRIKDYLYYDGFSLFVENADDFAWNITSALY